VTSATRLRLFYVALSLGLVVVDQITKYLIDTHMVLHESRGILNGVLQLTYVQNRGAVFGLFNTAAIPHQALLLSAIGLCALTAVVIFSLRLPASRLLPQTALALVLGGAIGNLIDRIRFGYVIDFIDAYWGTHHWPMFNAADSAITVGVGLLILDMLREPRAASESAASAGSSGRTE